MQEAVLLRYVIEHLRLCKSYYKANEFDQLSIAKISCHLLSSVLKNRFFFFTVRLNFTLTQEFLPFSRHAALLTTTICFEPWIDPLLNVRFFSFKMSSAWLTLKMTVLFKSLCYCALI